MFAVAVPPLAVPAATSVTSPSAITFLASRVRVELIWANMTIPTPVVPAGATALTLRSVKVWLPTLLVV